MIRWLHPLAMNFCGILCCLGRRIRHKCRRRLVIRMFGSYRQRPPAIVRSRRSFRINGSAEEVIFFLLIRLRSCESKKFFARPQQDLQISIAIARIQKFFSRALANRSQICFVFLLEGIKVLKTNVNRFATGFIDWQNLIRPIFQATFRWLVINFDFDFVESINRSRKILRYFLTFNGYVLTLVNQHTSRVSGSRIEEPY